MRRLLKLVLCALGCHRVSHKVRRMAWGWRGFCDRCGRDVINGRVVTPKWWGLP